MHGSNLSASLGQPQELFCQTRATHANHKNTRTTSFLGPEPRIFCRTDNAFGGKNDPRDCRDTKTTYVHRIELTKPDENTRGPFYGSGSYGSRKTNFMFFELLLEVLCSFPLRYLFTIGNLLVYLALEDMHPLYSAGNFKPTYSRNI